MSGRCPTSYDPFTSPYLFPPFPLPYHDSLSLLRAFLTIAACKPLESRTGHSVSCLFTLLSNSEGNLCLLRPQFLTTKIHLRRPMLMTLVLGQKSTFIYAYNSVMVGKA
ncbi:uncharacterized protein LOC131154552 isoform X2 [Malania oleifera]|uniref:uncharacterized protein LOC131154552 isoform X2 n=1 Tax=Malania oleifera TaxID=397392 RepID=UPI0025AEB875|nr:uncharacterized protein LOC131154552 isoform X2 [Malania oleifera]